MEWAKTFQIFSGSAQGDKRPDDIHNVAGVTNFLGKGGGIPSYHEGTFLDDLNPERSATAAKYMPRQ